MRRIIAGFVILNLLFVFTSAQAVPPTGANENVTQGPRRHLGTIIFAGVAGAILGLSTLSFYGRPQDELPNIAMGFAIGVIGGTMYTTYQAAVEPKDFYGWQNASPEAWALNEVDRDRRLEFGPGQQMVFSFTY